VDIISYIFILSHINGFGDGQLTSLEHYILRILIMIHISSILCMSVVPNTWKHLQTD
jgi:hypothetical protein